MILSTLGTSGLMVAPAHALNSKQWARSYGGEFIPSGSNLPYASFNAANAAEQTHDGGFIVAGTSDVFGPGPQCHPVPCDQAWVFKLDRTGNLVWQLAFGGMDDSGACCVHETSDHGFIVGGDTSVFGAGFSDAWILKLNGKGIIEWQNAYGGPSSDTLHSIEETSDGGFIAAGSTRSFGAGQTDAWLLKLDATGNIEWQKTYGGTGFETANSVHQTSDSGFIVAGSTNSFGAGFFDAWILKLDENGNVEWQNTYGTTGEDFANSVQETSDGGFIVAGSTSPIVPSGAINISAWLFKLDSTGGLEWSKTYGGSSYDIFYSVQETFDSGIVVAGVTDFGAGLTDASIVKLDGSGNVVWQNTYGGPSIDGAASVATTRDGGFIVAGAVDRGLEKDAWVLKLDSQGNIGGCLAESPSPATVTDNTTLVTITPTTISGTDSSATVTPTDAVITATSALEATQCA